MYAFCIKNLPMNINYPHPLEEQPVPAEVSSEQVVVGEEPPPSAAISISTPSSGCWAAISSPGLAGVLTLCRGAHFQGVNKQ